MKIGNAPRIITGIAKGKKLKVPESARPITDRVKTSIFDSLGDVVDGMSVLDLFAGSGTMGLEALSRGAKSAVFVDSDKHAAQTIMENIESTGLENADVYNVKAEDFLKQLDTTYDIIFIDPPYSETEKFDPGTLLNATHSGSLVIFRTPEIDVQISEGLELIDSKEMGNSIVWYFKPKAV